MICNIQSVTTEILKLKQGLNNCLTYFDIYIIYLSIYASINVLHLHACVYLHIIINVDTFTPCNCVATAILLKRSHKLVDTVMYKIHTFHLFTFFPFEDVTGTKEDYLPVCITCMYSGTSVIQILG